MGLPLERFLREVASEDLAPGAGYVAAVAVAMAAGLVAMTARRSRGQWPEAAGAAAQAEALRLRVAPLAEMNAEAYAAAVAALRPEEGASAEEGASVEGPSAEASARRDDALARALARSARIPMQIGEAACDVAALAAEVAEHGEPGVRPDTAAAASLAEAGARAAATLVEANLATTPADERVTRVRELVSDASAARERALAAVG